MSAERVTLLRRLATNGTRPELREALREAYREGHPYSQLGEVTGMPWPTVQGLIRQAEELASEAAREPSDSI